MGNVYDAMGNFTGIDDPATEVIKPSPDLAKPAEGEVPDPKGGPIVVAGVIKLGQWSIYAEGEKLFAKSPAGKKLQLELFDPLGVTETLKPNKLSDGADGSKGQSAGNTAITGRTVPSSGSSGSSGSSSSSSATPSAPAMPSSTGSTTPPAETNPNVTKTDFTSTDTAGKEAAEKFLGRAMSDEEWNNLVAATFAESNRDQQEQAWIMGTILNRTRQTGGTVMDTLNQQNQFTSVTGTPISPKPDDNFVDGPELGVEVSINDSAVNLLSTVPHNNYYYSPASRDAVQQGDSYVTQRAGVQGVLVGQSFVYPGAKWP